MYNRNYGGFDYIRIHFIIANDSNDTYFEPKNGTDDCNKFIDNSGKWKKISESEYSITLDEGE